MDIGCREAQTLRSCGASVPVLRVRSALDGTMEMRTSRGIDSGDLTSNIRGLIDYLSDQKSDVVS